MIFGFRAPARRPAHQAALYDPGQDPVAEPRDFLLAAQGSAGFLSALYEERAARGFRSTRYPNPPDPAQRRKPLRTEEEIDDWVVNRWPDFASGDVCSRPNYGPMPAVSKTGGCDPERTLGFTLAKIMTGWQTRSEGIKERKPPRLLSFSASPMLLCRLGTRLDWSYAPYPHQHLHR